MPVELHLSARVSVETVQEMLHGAIKTCDRNMNRYSPDMLKTLVFLIEGSRQTKH